MADQDILSMVELKNKIQSAFDVFDHESNKTVDIREIGTIIRSLNCCPTETELNEILNEIEEEESTGYISYEKFQPAMMRILVDQKYRLASEEKILKAFETLDLESKGYLTIDELQQYMTEEGEPFSQEELEEMFSAVIDLDKGFMYYKEFLSSMVVEKDEL